MLGLRLRRSWRRDFVEERLEVLARAVGSSSKLGEVSDRTEVEERAIGQEGIVTRARGRSLLFVFCLAYSQCWCLVLVFGGGEVEDFRAHVVSWRLTVQYRPPTDTPETPLLPLLPLVLPSSSSTNPPEYSNFSRLAPPTAPGKCRPRNPDSSPAQIKAKSLQLPPHPRVRRVPQEAGPSPQLLSLRKGNRPLCRKSLAGSRGLESFPRRYSTSTVSKLVGRSQTILWSKSPPLPKKIHLYIYIYICTQAKR